jgi:hypothetical protein
MTNDQPLPPDAAVASLERRMVELARTIGADRPPQVEHVMLASFVNGIATVLVLADIQAATGPVWFPSIVELDECELRPILDRLERLAPSLGGSRLH